MGPLQTRLKRETHRKIAYAQDLLIKETYTIFNNAVLHGGTAIWRCYQGNRFSEDLDFYLSRDEEKINLLFKKFEQIGFEVKKKKIAENSIYSELILDRTSVRFEATFQNIKGTLSDYELSNGNYIVIYSLTQEEFIIEKIHTYLKRLKIRDLWDIFFLLRNKEAPKELLQLLQNYKPPIDEDDLKTIILQGIVPTAEDMIQYIRKKWENKYI